MLDNNFKRQKEFYELVTEKLSSTVDLSEKQQIDWLKEYLICTIRELMEVLDEVPWKLHTRHSAKTIDKEKLLVELVDVQKFLWNIVNVFGFSLEEFCLAFDNKSDLVERKWEEFSLAL